MKKKAACLYLLLKISNIDQNQNLGSDLFQSIFTQKVAKKPKYESAKDMEVDNPNFKNKQI